MAIKEISFQKLLEQGVDSPEPIWVLNSSADSVLMKTGEVHIAIPKEHGGGFIDVRIEQTWLPQDLCVFATREQLLKSSEIRAAVRNKLIMLISAESAASLLKEEGADEELAQLAEHRRMMQQAGAARTIQDSGAQITALGGQEDTSVTIVGQNGQVERKDELSASFLMWVERMATAQDVKVMNEIRSRRKFSLKETKHMAKAFINKPKTVSMLKANIKMRKEKIAAKKAARA